MLEANVSQSHRRSRSRPQRLRQSCAPSAHIGSRAGAARRRLRAPRLWAGASHSGSRSTGGASRGAAGRAAPAPAFGHGAADRGYTEPRQTAHR
eukprot:7385629-Prymnesium_polylepis.1